MARHFNTEKVGRARTRCVQSELCSWGANSHGQLGQGHYEDRLVPNPVQDVPEFSFITGGGAHTLAITECGQLWTCGSNSRGQLGLTLTCNEDVPTFTRVASLEGHRVAHVAGGWDFTLAVTDKGQLFSWGSNSFGQLGFPDGQKGSNIPVLVSMEEPLRRIAAGLRHSVALTVSGRVFCWGHAKRGQCGTGPDGNVTHKVFTPRQVTLSPGAGNVTSVVAGSYHTAVLTDAGQVFAWGCNKYGQCGQDPDQVSIVTIPHHLDNLPPSVNGADSIVSLHSGWTHLVVLTVTGTLYSWGRGDYGQLGQEPVISCRYQPAPVASHLHVKQCVCGSEHTLFITDHGLCCVGWNEHGLCGTGDETNVHKITDVPSLLGRTVLQCGAGGGHCFVKVLVDTRDTDNR